MKTSLPLAAALLMLPFAAAADESFRCGQWIASSEMTVVELVQKCGEPASRTSETRDVTVRNRDSGLMVKLGETQIETWTYDRGTQAVPMVVIIVDGRIKSIDRQK
jgi:hypothetical protein